MNHLFFDSEIMVETRVDNYIKIICSLLFETRNSIWAKISPLSGFSDHKV